MIDDQIYFVAIQITLYQSSSLVQSVVWHSFLFTVRFPPFKGCYLRCSLIKFYQFLLFLSCSIIALENTSFKFIRVNPLYLGHSSYSTFTFSCSGSNDHTTKFWCRNRPGDTIRDKFNMGHNQGDCYILFIAYWHLSQVQILYSLTYWILSDTIDFFFFFYSWN